MFMGRAYYNKYGPIKSGIKPRVDGVARGVVHSCDSIQADTARTFIESFMDVT